MLTLFRIYFIPFTVADLLDILVIAFGIYVLLVLIRGTRARAMISGLAVILLLVLIAYSLDLKTVSWVVGKLGTVWVIAFLIVFQPELREILARVGELPIFRAFTPESTLRVVDDIVESARVLSETRVGALIAVQRQTSLDFAIRTGKSIDAKLAPELLTTIFSPHAPLHDGGVVVVENRIVSAACEFPLTENPRYRRSLGMRHRAAIGLTEVSDAVVVVVSEETGHISLALRGYLRKNIPLDVLKRLLEVILSGEKMRGR